MPSAKSRWKTSSPAGPTSRRLTSNTLPEWREGVATLTESATTFAYDTPFDRETYEMLRARNLPMFCYAAAAGSDAVPGD